MGVVHTLFVYTVACIVAAVAFFRLAIRYVSNPSGYPVKKRDKPPACLTDPVYGHGYLNLKEVKIHYVEKGDKSKPLMLFVHGFPEFWYSWRHQIKEFSKDYWTVAIDLRGYGDSDKPSGVEKYAIHHLVNDIKEIVEALGRKKCILVAHDWGGAVAWGFVIKHHEMVDKYIIMDAPHPAGFVEAIRRNKKQFFCSLYMFFYQLPYLPEILISSFDFGIFRPLFRGGKHKSVSLVTDEDIEAFKYNFSKPGAITPPLNYYRANLMRSRPTRPPSKTLDIAAPGLLMFGELDKYLVLDHMPLAQKYVKGLQVRTVKGANHFVQQDDPETVNKYMREFLGQSSQ